MGDNQPPRVETVPNTQLKTADELRKNFFGPSTDPDMARIAEIRRLNAQS